MLNKLYMVEYGSNLNIQRAEFKITLCYIREFKNNLDSAEALAAGLRSHQVTE